MEGGDQYFERGDQYVEGGDQYVEGGEVVDGATVLVGQVGRSRHSMFRIVVTVESELNYIVRIIIRVELELDC